MCEFHKQTRWLQREIKSLIEFFQGEDDLWNISSANYSKKDYRMRALERMAENMENKFTGSLVFFYCVHIHQM